MNQIIQNIKEFSSRVITLVFENKGLALGIVAFVALSSVGGFYLYYSYLGSEVKQAEVVDVSFSSRVSDVLSKLSPAQKFGLVSTMPVLTAVYKVLRLQVSGAEDFVYETITVFPTKLQVILFSRVSKILMIWSTLFVLGLASDRNTLAIAVPEMGPSEKQKAKPTAQKEIIPQGRWFDVRAFLDADLLERTKKIEGFASFFAIQIKMMVPRLCHTLMLILSIVYQFAYFVCCQVAIFSINYLYPVLAFVTVVYGLIYFKVPYAYDLLNKIHDWAVWISEYPQLVLRLIWNTLSVDTIENKYLRGKLISTRTLQSVPVNFPWSFAFF
jgi:hypothetical protein